MAVRSADQLMAAAVREAVDALDLQPEDAAAKRLAISYAEAIDAADDEDGRWVIGTVGPSLLKCLESLGATPAARASIGKRVDDGGSSQLAKLRAARR